MSAQDLIAAGDRLTRAVVISLFTWRRAEASDPVDDDERYGYWGDAYPDRPGDRIGSRMWLLRRRTVTAETLLDAERYAREALVWMTEDLVVERVDVRVERVGRGRIDLIVILWVDGEQRELRFDDVLGVINAV